MGPARVPPVDRLLVLAWHGLSLALALAAIGCGESSPAAPCGNGALDADEVCDGDSVTCASLGASWSSGNATCRASCAGFDTSACTALSTGGFEAVKPAEREPARFAAARCNDGTPFTFYLSLAPAASSVWMIHLQGGVYCDDATMPCATRDVILTTTQAPTDRMLLAANRRGILSRSATVIT